MKKACIKIAAGLVLASSLSGCARDLSSDMYLSDSTMNLTLEGVVISVRPVNIKDSESKDIGVGTLAGGAMGAALGSNVGGGQGKVATTVGGAILGGVAGSLLQQKLGEQKGMEYIVKVDTSNIKDVYYEGNTAMRNTIAAARSGGLLTIVQGADKHPLHVGQKVFVILSDNRTRAIPAS